MFYVCEIIHSKASLLHDQTSELRAYVHVMYDACCAQAVQHELSQTAHDAALQLQQAGEAHQQELQQAVADATAGCVPTEDLQQSQSQNTLLQQQMATLQKERDLLHMKVRLLS